MNSFRKDQTIAVENVPLRVVVQATVLVLERSVVRKGLVSNDEPGMVVKIQ